MLQTLGGRGHGLVLLHGPRLCDKSRCPKSCLLMCSMPRSFLVNRLSLPHPLLQLRVNNLRRSTYGNSGTTWLRSCVGPLLFCGNHSKYHSTLDTRKRHDGFFQGFGQRVLKHTCSTTFNIVNILEPCELTPRSWGWVLYASAMWIKFDLATEANPAHWSAYLFDAPLLAQTRVATKLAGNFPNHGRDGNLERM